MTLLAHSADPDRGVPEQPYADHVNNVVRVSVLNTRNMLAFRNEPDDGLENIVRTAATYHDLGKMYPKNQQAMKGGHKPSLPVNHVDAGTAHLYCALSQAEAAILAYSHHIGLISVPKEAKKGTSLFLRDPKIAEYTNKHLSAYHAKHEQVVEAYEKRGHAAPKLTSMERRLALSCLVDADHGDTARHYGDEKSLTSPPTRWKERIASLDKYVSTLAKNAEEAKRKTSLYTQRSQLRSDIYHACCNIDISLPICSCDAPVGSGKTTAVMAHLLRIAEKKHLRHIFVVLPYTNIIKQSVDVYRKALVLPHENPEEIVAAHHHQVEFSEPGLRHLTTLWKAPIIVTTAVQFFETLAHHKPARLRKLHELPGSAIFIDESHAAIPPYMWPQVWLWLNELGDNWNCHFVLGSGSLAKFWRLQEFVNPPADIKDIVPDSLRHHAVELEDRRIIPRRHVEAFTCEKLQEFILAKSGPRLVILNTVQSAGAIAQALQQKGRHVLHLSSALCPRDRDAIVERIKRLLSQRNYFDWTLVATSCVEAGMDFSFRTAFRESCTTASLIQTSGRVNRHAFWEKADVWDFRVHHDGVLTSHPAFDISKTILQNLFDEGVVTSCSPSELVTEALKREVLKDPDHRIEEIKKTERAPDYPRVTDLCKIINADTKLVVVDNDIVSILEERGKGEKLSSNILQRHSVQLWSHKIQELGLTPITGLGEIYKWELEYDPDFLGIMSGVLQFQRFLAQGGDII